MWIVHTSINQGNPWGTRLLRALDRVGMWNIRLARGWLLIWGHYLSLGIQCFGSGTWTQSSRSAGMALCSLDIAIDCVIPEDLPPHSSSEVLKDVLFLNATECACKASPITLRSLMVVVLCRLELTVWDAAIEVVILGIQEDKVIKKWQKPGGSTESSEARWI